MNIAQLKQLQAVDGWVDFSGQITEVKEMKVRTKKNRMMTKVKLKDETDEIGAWIYSDLQQITPNQLIIANGMLKEYEHRRYIDYATVKTTQPAPQNTQQDTPQPTGQANGKKDVDWDAKELREKRGYAIRDAVLVKTTLASVSNNIATHLSESSIFELAEKFVEYVYNGIDKATNSYQRNPHEEPPDDDIPF